jgi:hypothetical protein
MKQVSKSRYFIKRLIILKNMQTKIVYCKFITRNGKRIYPRNGKVFRFWVDKK